MLDSLLADGIIDEVLGRLMSGKEADVFRVIYRGEEIVAKVYKDRAQRSFKHNAAYKEGRTVRNSRTQRAMDKGSRFGQGESEEAWKTAESQALHKLHHLGIRVPVPVMFYEGVLLMQLVTDAEGYPAPRLIDAPIRHEDAAALYSDIRRQIIGMLCCDLIHGDLSPYNVLLGAAGPTIIDFPQTISAAHNSLSENFFRRDCDNIFRFFAGIDPALHAHGGDARQIWQAYVRRDLTPDFVPAAVAREDRRAQNPQRPPNPNAPQNGSNARGQQPRQAPQQPRQAPQQPHPPSQQPARQGPPRDQGPRPGNAQARKGPARPQAPPAPRGPAVMYLRRTGTREAPPHREPEGTVVQPRAPQQPPQPQRPTRPEEGGHGRRRRR